MPKTIKEERKRWILPIFNKEVRLVDMAKVCPHSKRSLERWLSNYRKYGEKGLEPESTAPKTSPNQTKKGIKKAVIKKRKETHLCAKKIHWRLKKEGLEVPVRTIGKILKKEKLTRKYKSKKMKYKYVKEERQPGDLIEIDVKYVPGRIKNKRYYQYTAIDTASRWRYLKIFDGQYNHHSVLFLKEVIDNFKYRIRAVKTDNGPCFTNRYNGTYKREDLSPKKLHAFDVCCAENNIVHYLIDPGKPAQNGKVERSHRSDQENFYDKHDFKSVKELERKIKIWNNEYNNLEHCGLNGKTPLEFLSQYSFKNRGNIKLKKPTKVLA